MSMKPFVKLQQVTLFKRALHQKGELDQPEVHPIFFQRSPAFRLGTFCQILEIEWCRRFLRTTTKRRTRKQ